MQIRSKNLQGSSAEKGRQESVGIFMLSFFRESFYLQLELLHKIVENHHSKQMPSAHSGSDKTTKSRACNSISLFEGLSLYHSKAPVRGATHESEIYTTILATVVAVVKMLVFFSSREVTVSRKLFTALGTSLTIFHFETRFDKYLCDRGNRGFEMILAFPLLYGQCPRRPSWKLGDAHASVSQFAGKITGDHFHCAVEPSPGHIRCRNCRMVCTIFLGKQRKRVYTIGPERRVYTIEASDSEKEKGGFHGGGVYFFFPAGHDSRDTP